jgi:predicted nuclease of predicted toxin-antitoxin system
MIKIYSNENFPFGVVERLREMQYDVLTTKDAGKSGEGIPDEEVLRFAIQEERALITLNRKDFIQLHKVIPNHWGIIVCTVNHDLDYLAQKIDSELDSRNQDVKGLLLRVYKD